MSNSSRSMQLLLGIIATILVGFVLYYTRPVTVLVIVAMFLALLLEPAVHWLQKRVPRWVALSVVFFGMALLFSGFGASLSLQVRSILDELPRYAERFEGMTEGFFHFLNRFGLHVTWDDLGAPDNLREGLGVLTSGIRSLALVLGEVLLVLVLVVFMLVEAPALRRKSAELFEAPHTRMVLHSAAKKVQSYVRMKTLVSATTGFLTGVVTWSMGLDFALIWGVIAFQLNFIPNIGSVIAVIPPTLLAFIQFEGASGGLAVLLVLASIQGTIGYIIEPRLMGRSLHLSPLVILISLLFWGWFWGVLGVVLAVPLTAVIKIACEDVEPLRPVAVVLGDGRKDLPPADEGP
ncbi:MAG: AI-2E family transporter [Myxococcota bacterium]